MLSHEKMVALHAEKHTLIDTLDLQSKDKFVQHLIHTFAYTQASRLAENRRVLDLGCNTGYGSAMLFGSASKVVGVDVSEKAVLAANEQYGHLGILFQLIDGKRLPFEDNEFDMIVSCQVVEHIIDYDIYFGEMKRVLAPGGIVFLTTPNAHLRLDPGMKPWNKFHVREFTDSELESFLSGFFTAVRIWGLFAKEPLYSIEKNRLNRARENARKRIDIRSLVRAMIPVFVLTRLRKMINPHAGNSQMVDQAFVEEHGIDDFFYRTDNLLEALDFMTVCSNDEDGLQEVQNLFPT